jgi:hypothetical protein
LLPEPALSIVNGQNGLASIWDVAE